MDRVRTERRGTYALAGVLLVVLAFFPYVRGTRVPILGWVDLAIHEAGHVFFAWAPHDVTLVMGNGFQALVPMVFAGAFAIQHRDLAGAAVGLAWCASALHDASVYIADAPVRLLPLLGPESSHDWWQLLGRHGMLDRADVLASAVWLFGVLLLSAAVVVFVVGLRWDPEWRAGDAGTVYWPWDRVEPDSPPTVPSSGPTGPPPPDEEPPRGRVIW